MTSTNIRRGNPQRVHATMEFDEGHALQVLELPSGIRAVVESGRVLDQLPVARIHAAAPPEVGEEKAGERADDGPTTFSAGEQQWFRDTFCNGAQACAQGWDWAVSGTQWAVGAGTGIAMVGSEGTQNATLTVSMWECICVGPFCVGGHDCFWVGQWTGLVVPGHWISVETRPSDNAYLRWNLDGAGGNTQVSLAAQYH